MKKTLSLSIILFFVGSTLFAQEKLDSIFTTSEILVVNVKEVTEESVKYSYPDEDILNTLSLDKVSKIVFKSGRTQNFSNDGLFAKVRNGMDWEHVTVIQNDRELKGLIQLDQVNAKAKAATGWGSVGKMENRAKRKLLIETAMNGGNVVFLTQQSSSTRSQNSTSSSVMGGVAYGSSVPNYSLVKEMVEKVDGFKYVENHSLGVNSDDMKVKTQNGELVKLSNVEKSGQLTYVTASIPGLDLTKFRVSYLDNQEIILVYRTKKQIVNIILLVS